MDSDASRLITDALKELSRRAGERGQRAVVKIMYDRGNAKQVCMRLMSLDDVLTRCSSSITISS